MQDRITQLEGLVVSLMNSANVKPSSAPGLPKPLEAQENELSNSFGRTSLENSEMRYVSADHWIAILDGVRIHSTCPHCTANALQIAELKDHFEDNSPRPSPSQFAESSGHASDGPSLLFGYHSHATKESILASIPQRPVADQLVSKYFKAKDMASSVIHGPTFLKEYEQFWQNPSETPVMWIGLLFALSAIGAHIQQRESNQLQSTPAHQRVLHSYKEKAVRCLILGKYTKVVPHKQVCPGWSTNPYATQQNLVICWTTT